MCRSSLYSQVALKESVEMSEREVSVRASLRDNNEENISYIEHKSRVIALTLSKCALVIFSNSQ